MVPRTGSPCDADAIIGFQTGPAVRGDASPAELDQALGLIGEGTLSDAYWTAARGKPGSTDPGPAVILREAS